MQADIEPCFQGRLPFRLYHYGWELPGNRFGLVPFIARELLSKTHYTDLTPAQFGVLHFALELLWELMFTRMAPAIMLDEEGRPRSYNLRALVESYDGDETFTLDELVMLALDIRFDQVFGDAERAAFDAAMAQSHEDLQTQQIAALFAKAGKVAEAGAYELDEEEAGWDDLENLAYTGALGQDHLHQVAPDLPRAERTRRAWMWGCANLDRPGLVLRGDGETFRLAVALPPLRPAGTEHLLLESVAMLASAQATRGETPSFVLGYRTFTPAERSGLEAVFAAVSGDFETGSRTAQVRGIATLDGARCAITR